MKKVKSNTGDVFRQYWISDNQDVVAGFDKLGRSRCEAVTRLSDSADELSWDAVDHKELADDCRLTVNQFSVCTSNYQPTLVVIQCYSGSSNVLRYRENTRLAMI